MNQTQFNEALTSLVEYAAANANHVSKKDIEIYFGDIIEDEAMYAPIYNYLRESKIAIDDLDEGEISGINVNMDENASTPENTNSDGYDVENKDNESSITASLSKKVASEEELKFIEMYKNDMANIKSLESAERKALIENMKQGDAAAMATLTEDCLSIVHEIATNFTGRGLTLGDLIQEGNIGLMLCLPEFTGETEDFDNYVREKVSEAIDEAISIQVNSERISSHLAQRMNSLDDISKELTEKLGHAPSIEELSEEMHISTDEVETIIRTSLNVLTVSGENAGEGEGNGTN
ncbi:MAG: hypothetical protein E7254_00725 [Lachnospiraceae bacterium]|nr:hypothetical protein [Lachnospiraceae bacterium]